MLIQWEKDGPWYNYDGKLATEAEIKQWQDIKEKSKLDRQVEIKAKEMLENYLRERAEIGDKYILGIERAFYGIGGGIFEEHYIEALFGEKSLSEIVGMVRVDMKSDMEDDYEIKEADAMDRLLKMKTNTPEKCCEFLVNYFEEVATREGHPELCGEIVGTMVRLGYKKYAEKILQFDNLEKDEFLYWDS